MLREKIVRAIPRDLWGSREVIPQVRPATPPPCLLLISGQRGGTFELHLFVLADNIHVHPSTPTRLGHPAAGHESCSHRAPYANHKFMPFDVSSYWWYRSLFNDIDGERKYNCNLHRVVLMGNWRCTLNLPLSHFFNQHFSIVRPQ